jgi:hypothetical protein
VKYLQDGVASIFRGITEIATTPFSWTIKPICRSISTALSEEVKIENNPGIKKLVRLGLEQLTEYKEDEVSRYKLFALSHDIHRKFTKACERQQKTDIALEEYSEYALLRATKSKEQLHKYFSLIANSNINSVSPRSSLKSK